MADEVASLPGWDGPLPSRHFSGHLPVHASQWHYHLTEATLPDPTSAPLVLYCSGGPGGSSFATQFRGFGQFRLDERSLEGEEYESTGVPQLLQHEYGWTNAANVLAWECPPGAHKLPSTAPRLRLFTKNAFKTGRNWETQHGVRWDV